MPGPQRSSNDPFVGNNAAVEGRLPGYGAVKL